MKLAKCSPNWEILLGLHASVLEPNLDLTVGQPQSLRDLDAALPGQVLVGVELLLQLQRLETGVGLARALAIRVHCPGLAITCNINKSTF